MEELLTSPKALITSLATLAIVGAGFRIIKAVISVQVVEWAVMRSLTWLAKQSKSEVDDELVALVRESLQHSPVDLAVPSGTSQPTEVNSAPVCPSCGRPMPE